MTMMSDTVSRSESPEDGNHFGILLSCRAKEAMQCYVPALRVSLDEQVGDLLLSLPDPGTGYGDLVIVEESLRSVVSDFHEHFGVEVCTVPFRAPTREEEAIDQRWDVVGMAKQFFRKPVVCFHDPGYLSDCLHGEGHVSEDILGLIGVGDGPVDAPIPLLCTEQEFVMRSITRVSDDRTGLVLSVFYSAVVLHQLGLWTSHIPLIEWSSGFLKDFMNIVVDAFSTEKVEAESPKRGVTIASLSVTD